MRSQHTEILDPPARRCGACTAALAWSPALPALLLMLPLLGRVPLNGRPCTALPATTGRVVARDAGSAPDEDSDLAAGKR